MSDRRWRYFVVEMRDDTWGRTWEAGADRKALTDKEQLLYLLTFCHPIRGWAKVDGKIIICLTKKTSLPELRGFLQKFREYYPDCDVTEVLCKGSKVEMRYCL